MDETETIVKNLKEQEVKFLVIGGIASVLYGVSRATFDIDILLPPEKKMIQKALQVFKKRHFKELHNIDKAEKGEYSLICKIEDATSEKILEFKSVKLKNLTDVDILLAPSIAFFDFLWGYRVEVHLGKNKIPIPTLIDLIHLKEQSGRPKDIEDVKALRLILGKSSKQQ